MRNRTNFRWGVATSAYQIEGGRHEGGKGESIWDRFSDTGRMPESGDVACDHYHRYPEDIALMADLGVDVYRFSAAWTRVIPDGDGAVNQAGLDFYSRLVDGMLDAGITPWLTLYHWDLPQALEDRGGWTHRDTAYAFARYTEVMVSTLGDRVAHWITHNEPWVSANLGYGEGVFAPGRTGKATALAAAHHILVSHGLATDAIRSLQASAQVGIALDCRTARPASSKPEDVAAARYFDGHRNRWFFDPVFGLGYPTDVLETFV
ncbi:MAG: family 1 glycosylhydrolase, partial [Acidimicrobiia bacterium]|nr:family 1 glycosylhydrolase [Acidimicrobiia bacterium]